MNTMSILKNYNFLDIANGSLKSGDITKHVVNFPDQNAHIFSGSIMKLPSGIYRMYYSRVDSKKKTMSIAIAESCDKINWDLTPVDGKVLNSQNASSIVINELPQNSLITQPSVILLPDGTFRMYFWLHGQKTRYITAESSNGIEWRCLNLHTPCLYHPNDESVEFSAVPGLTPFSVRKGSPPILLNRKEHLKIKRLLSNDSTMVYYNRFKKHYEMYTVGLLPNPRKSGQYVSHDNAPMIYRVIEHRISNDGLAWDDPELIFYPDDADPDFTQFYYHTVGIFEGYKLGLLGRYYCNEQKIEPELTVCFDDEKWQRPLQDTWIPLGNKESNDWGMISPATTTFLEMKNSYNIFYTGCSYLHNASVKSNRKDQIMMAEIKRDRIVGIKTDPGMECQITTRPFFVNSPQIQLNTSVVSSLHAELTDVFGQPLKGYSFLDFVEYKGDSESLNLVWRKDLNDILYDAVKLKIKMNDGIIYDIDIGEKK